LHSVLCAKQESGLICPLSSLYWIPILRQVTGAAIAAPHWLQCFAVASFRAPQLGHFTAETT
jgi:hypothetical protein